MLALRRRQCLVCIIYFSVFARVFIYIYCCLNTHVRVMFFNTHGVAFHGLCFACRSCIASQRPCAVSASRRQVPTTGPQDMQYNNSTESVHVIQLICSA